MKLSLQSRFNIFFSAIVFTSILVFSPYGNAAESSVSTLLCAGSYEQRNISLSGTPSLPDKKGNATVSVTVSLRAESTVSSEKIVKIALVTSPNLGYLGFVGKSAGTYVAVDESTNNLWRLRNEYEDETVNWTSTIVIDRVTGIFNIRKDSFSKVGVHITELSGTCKAAGSRNMF